jgi:hypothetical protein
MWADIGRNAIEDNMGSRNQILGLTCFNAGRAALFSSFVTAVTMVILSCAPQVRLAPKEQAASATVWSSAKGPLWRQADSLFALRRDPKVLRHAEALYARAAMAQPQVPALLSQWSRACYLTALYGNLENEQSHAYYRRGVDAGEAALQLHSGYARVFSQSSDETEAASVLSGPFLEAAYWVAANEGRLLNESDRFVRRGRGGQVAALVNRLLTANDTLFAGGPHRLAGVMALRMPGNWGAALNESRRHFQTAKSLWPTYVANQTVFAEFYAPAIGDRALFQTTLETLLASPDDSLSVYAAENSLEKMRTRKLLKRTDALFPVKASQADP